MVGDVNLSKIDQILKCVSLKCAMLLSSFYFNHKQVEM